jgi:hypothetical protein
VMRFVLHHVRIHLCGQAVLRLVADEVKCGKGRPSMSTCIPKYVMSQRAASVAMA